MFNQVHNAKAALEILEAALAKMDATGQSPQPRFLLLASDCAGHLGETKRQINLLGRGLNLQPEDKVLLAQIAVEHAKATFNQEGPARTLERLRQAASVFTEAKDERSEAITMGQIADILSQRGETEEALRIWIEECLPLVQKLQDQDLIARVRFLCAQLRLDCGNYEEGEIQTILEELAESFAIFNRLQRADGIAAAGHLLGSIMVQCGLRDEGLEILDQSVTAFETLQMHEQAANVRELQRQAREAQGSKA